MRFDAFIPLLPLVVAAHNAEEYAQLGRFSSAFHSRLPARLSSRQVIGAAMVLVTLVAAALSIAASLSGRAALLTALRISIFALGWNAIGHATLSLSKRTVLPGTVSALAIVLPYSIASAIAMHTQFSDSLTRLATLAMAGAVALPVIILVAATLGYAFTRALDLLRDPCQPSP